MTQSILEMEITSTTFPVRTLLFFKCIVACAAVGTTDTANKPPEFFPRPGPSVKHWRLTTNFEDFNNWQGLNGQVCVRDIYSFPPWYDQENVVTYPSELIAQQIILPVNGHFVFGEGSSVFLNEEAARNSKTKNNTCRGREVQFVRDSPADWFDPDNWSPYIIKHGENDNLATAITNLFSLENVKAASKAIPHVERVPCQYDSVIFYADSTFNLRISANVTIAKFFFGDKVVSQANLSALMNSPLGKLQFRKAPQTIFSITDNGTNNVNNNNGNSGRSSSLFCQEGKKKGDSDLCICSNYMDQKTTQRICWLANCDSDQEGNAEDSCPNPIKPHGFCCPICGFHVKIQHSGNLRLIPLYEKLKAEVGRRNLRGKVQAHLARYKRQAAHLILVPSVEVASASATTDSLLGQVSSLVAGIESILNQESEVIGVTVIESWGGLYPSGGSSDRLAGSSLGAGAITLLVLLCLVAVLGGIAIAIFIWNKKSGYPPLTLSSVTASLPRMSDIRIPIVAGAGRRSSTLSSSLQSFGFARFTNERVSTITIGQAPSQEGGVEGREGSSKLQKSSSIRRAEEVDDQVPEKIIDSNSGAYGFSNVTYDLVAGVANESNENTVPDTTGRDETGIIDEAQRKTTGMPVLQIPEIKIKESDELPVIHEKVRESSPVPTSSTSSLALPSKGKSDTKRRDEGKGRLPGFVASRIAKAYQKLSPDEEAPEDKKEDVGVKEDGKTTNDENLDEKEEEPVQENSFTQQGDTESGSVETLVSFLEE